MISVPIVAGLVVFVPMLIEAAIAGSNARTLRAQGAIEPTGDVFGAMQFAYPAAFLVMIVEGDLRQVQPDRLVVAGMVVFVGVGWLTYQLHGAANAIGHGFAGYARSRGMRLVSRQQSDLPPLPRDPPREQPPATGDLRRQQPPGPSLSNA